MWRRSCRSSWWSSSSPVVSRVFVPLACNDFRPAQLTDYRPGSTSMLQRRTWGWALCKRHAKLIQVLENALQRASHRASAIPVARTWATPEASASRFWPAPAAAHQGRRCRARRRGRRRGDGRCRRPLGLGFLSGWGISEGGGEHEWLGQRGVKCPFKWLTGRRCPRRTGDVAAHRGGFGSGGKFARFR